MPEQLVNDLHLVSLTRLSQDDVQAKPVQHSINPIHRRPLSYINPRREGRAELAPGR